MVLFRAAVWDYTEQERATHSFLDLAARHWATLDGVLGMSTAISTMFTRAMSIAMRAFSMPLWHFVSNAEVEALVAGEEETRPITANLLVSPAAGEPCEFGKIMMALVSHLTLGLSWQLNVIS